MPLPLPLDTVLDNSVASLVDGLDKMTQVPTPKALVLGENGCPEVSVHGMCQDTEGALVAIYSGLLRDSDNKKVLELFGNFEKTLNGQSDENKAEYCRYLISLVFHTRDCRGGKGERLLFRRMLLASYKYFPKTIESLVQYIPSFGYWKDLNELLVDIGTQEGYDGLRNVIYTIMSEQISCDIENLNLWELDKKSAMEQGLEFNKKLHLTLVAKWAPKENSSYDRKIKAAKQLAIKIYPREFGIDYRTALKQYRKTISRLNRAINTTEVLMCEKRFSEIQFKLVPGKCLTRYRRAFLNQKQMGEDLRYPDDDDRMKCRNNILKFMEDVKSGKRKINANQLFIHEIVEKLFHNNASVGKLSNEEVELYELCWKEIVGSYRKQIENGEISLNRGIVLADVSGSMSGTPMMVSIAAAILISELLDEPYRGRFMTFDTTPQWFNIPIELSLQKKISMVAGSPWGGSTNFLKAMDLILDVAQSQKLKQTQMPEWFLVLSDMQFNSANEGQSWKTMYEKINENFASVGQMVCGEPYKPPQIIFWNLRGNTNGFPVVADQPGCVMVSGFSVAILKEIFRSQDLRSITPWLNLKSTLDGNRYEIIRKTVTSLAESPYFSIFSNNEPDVVSEQEASKTDNLTTSGSLLNYITSFFSRS